MKNCKSCQSQLPYSSFHKAPGNPDGYNAHCKDCRRGYCKIVRKIIHCEACQLNLPTSSFSKKKGSITGFRNRCKQCYIEYGDVPLEKTQPRKNYERYRNEHRNIEKTLRDFGHQLTIDEYFDLYDKQKGLCLICENPETATARNGAPRRLAIDHCHDTGMVRGLLCHNCNIGLGNFRDNVDRLKKAIIYLEAAFAEHGGVPIPVEEKKEYDYEPLIRAIKPSERQSKLGKSGFRGVKENKRSRRWIARINCKGKEVHIGSFATAEEANEACIKARAELQQFRE